MRLRFDLDKFGSYLVILATIATLCSLGVVGAMKTAAADLHLQMNAMHDDPNAAARSTLGSLLSTWLAGDVAADDVAGLDARAQELDHRSDRLLEATAVLTLVGMLAALLTARPASHQAGAREATTPLANTNSNGTV